MPFRAPLDVPVWTLSAGEKQKLQILKQLYLNQRFLILDEPTSVLTPDEAEELLGRLRDMTRAGELTICLITHKLREVRAFADEVTVLRRGEVVGVGADSRSDECGHRKVDGRGYSSPVALDQPQTCAAGGSPRLRNPRLGRG